MDNGEHHECEIFEGTVLERVECGRKWKNCKKNPGHEKFISARCFKDIHLPKVQDLKSREWLRSQLDLTVRLTVYCTSKERPDNDQLSYVRGTRMSRTGTGCIVLVDGPSSNRPCPCVVCDGNITQNHWRFRVRTARRVVYNTEEARETKVDLFLDDESCEQDGRMKSVWGVEVEKVDPFWDRCEIVCVTYDEDLGERIEAASRYCNTLTPCGLALHGQDFLQACGKDRDLAVIVSHPHGQPKSITVGEWRGQDYPRLKYTVPTCPGSSGATVFKLNNVRLEGRLGYFDLFLNSSHIHCGSYSKTATEHEDQFNYGFYC